MNVVISDDFDLEKIANCGQCFRVRKFVDACGAVAYRFITRNDVLYIKEADTQDHASKKAVEYSVSCTRDVWEKVWVPYFDLHRNYAQIRASIPKSDVFMQRAASDGCGIRILKQDAWEMLITFIISQRKSIPAIQNSVELLCQTFGSKRDVFSSEKTSDMPSKMPAERPSENMSTKENMPVSNRANQNPTPSEKTIHLFPSPEQMALATPSSLKDCKLGYRVPYVLDAAQKVSSGELNMTKLECASDEDLLKALKSVHGVGDKVANCISLFAYARCNLAPVDTWIQKIIDFQYAGKNPFFAYGSTAGIMQQYAFLWAINNKAQFS